MKKALSLLLVLVLALSMSTVAFAAGEKVDGFDADVLWDGIYEYEDIDLSPSHIDWRPNSFTINGKNQADFDGIATGFATEGILVAGTSAYPTASLAALTDAGVKKAKLTVEIKASKGGQYLDEAVFIYEGAKVGGKGTLSGVKIVMVDEFASNNPDGVDYSYRLYLSLNKKIGNDNSTYKDGVTIKGNFANAEDEIEDEDFYAFFDGRILRPQTFVKNLEGWLDEDGDGVLRMRALKGAKYWALGSHDDWTEKDDAITEKYPEIDGVYHINQRGLTNVVANVEFPNYDPTYYVYTPDGETLKYVGRAGAKNLPLVDTYYFSVSELDVDEFEPEDDEDGDDDWDYDENEETGGDDLYPSNPHDNPGTGR